MRRAAAAPLDAPADPDAAPGAARAAVGSGALVIVGIALVAVNLRAAVTSLGALLDEVTAALGLSSAMAGVVTMLPTLCFAGVGAAAPWLARRFTPARIIVVAMVALAAGQAARAVTDSAAVFLVTSAVALGGIAVANVLLPALVKEYFPDRIGVVTGVYTMMLILGTTVAAAVAVPIADAAGTWRAGLGVWALLAAVAVGPWLPGALRGTATALRAARERRAGRADRAGEDEPADGAGSAERGGSAERAGRRRGGGSRHTRPRPARTRVGWAMALYFGTQSLSGYSLMGWLAQLFRDAGSSPARAGLLLAAVTAIGVPVAMLMPTLAGRLVDLRPLVLTLSGAMIAAYVGLAVAAGPLAWLWVVLLAIGQAAFPLALTMIGLRTRTPAGTVALSGFAQSTGYLIAGLGPLLVGVLYGATGGWTVPLAFLLAMILVQTGAGLAVARPRYLEDETDPVAPR